MSTCFVSLALVLAGSSFASVAEASPSIDVLASAALGDELGGQPSALAVLDDGTVVLVGADAEGGTLVRLDAAGIATASVRLDGLPRDVAVDRRTGRVAIVDDDGLLVLDPALALEWRAPLPRREAERHVDVGEHGTIAVAVGDELRAFGSDGESRFVHTLPGSAAGVAVLDVAGLVVAFADRRARVCGREVDAPVLEGFALDGALQWSTFGGGASGCEVASARAVDVTRGDDGGLYVLAEVDGPRTTLQSEPIDVAFDVTTTITGETATTFAWYARMSIDGEPHVGQFFGFPDAEAVVHPAAIAADEHGNVVLTGTTTHGLEVDQDVLLTDALYAPSGFYQMIRADFGARELWRSLEIDDASTTSTALALAGAHAVTLLAARRLPNADDRTPTGPMVLTWPTDPKHDVPRRPDRDDIGTFGYESGVAGSDPTCYACGPTRQPGPVGVLALLAVLAGLRPRRRAS